MKHVALLAAFVLVACDGRTPPTPHAACATSLSPCVTACRGGDRDACSLAKTMLATTTATLAGTSPARRELLDLGCSLDDAQLCAQAAIAHLGQAPSLVLTPANKAFRLQPQGSFEAARGRPLVREDFDPVEVAETHRQSAACNSGNARACRHFADRLFAFDTARALATYRESCELGGIGAQDVDACASFRAGLAAPPTCPGRPAGPGFTYPQCPSEAKVAPRTLAPIALEAVTAKADDDGPFRRALDANREQLAWCHTAATRDDPTLHSQIAVQLVIDANGDVAELQDTVTGTTNPYELDCVRRQIAKLALTAPPRRMVRASFVLELARR